MAFLNIINQVKENTSKIISEKGYDEVGFVVEYSRSGFGDITCNVAFLLAKKLKKNPREIAEEFAGEYNLGNDFEKVEAHKNGYLNFFINNNSFTNTVLHESLKENYGSIDIGEDSRLLIEHTSVNPNKALHIGHLRNVVVGDSISRILSKVNYDVKVLNYIDDSGLQVADLIIGFKFGGFSLVPPNGEKFDHYCGDTVYVTTTANYENDKKLENKRNDVLKELEDRNSEIAKFGKEVTRKVLAEQLKTVWNLGITYDCLNFESDILYSELWKKIFDRMKSENITHLETEGDNAGCWVTDVSYLHSDQDADEKVLVRSNGVPTYIAKDIPYAAWKLGILDDPFNYVKYVTQQNGRILYETTLGPAEPTPKFTGDKAITIIDNRQIRLQEIVSNLMDRFKAPSEYIEEGFGGEYTDFIREYIHLGYETVTLSSETVKLLGFKTDGKDAQMSGRKGIYVNADEIIEKLQKRIFAESKQRNSDLDDSSLNEISHNIAVGTLKYELIKPDLGKIITFDINTSLKLEGDTCSYIQYSCVRAARILEKFGKEPNFDTKFDQLNTEYETNLIKQIGMFEIFVKSAAGSTADISVHSLISIQPKVIAKYCYDLAVAFSSFYEHVNVLKGDTPELINARVCLVLSFKLTLEKSLDLLGIIAPQRM